MIKYLGVDWGGKRIGLALGDDETNIATPFKVVENIDEISEVISEEDIDAVVIGQPLSMADVKFPMIDEFNDFVEELRNSIDLPIKMYDERLSSKAADNLSGDKKTKASRDELAAMIILQGYLDKNNPNATN